MMNDFTEAELFAEWTARERNAFFSSLSEKEQQDFLYRWNFWARPGQMPPDGDWSVWLIMAGRGFGKTRAGAEWVRGIAEGDGSARFALVGANYAETRTVMVEGESGLLSIAPPKGVQPPTLPLPSSTRALTVCPCSASNSSNASA